MADYRNLQPEFWLEIRKEYIIENFEKLLSYLRAYRYDGTKDSNGEFLTTCRYLVDLADELSENSTRSSFISSPKFILTGSNLIVPNILAYRIIAAAIIASQKIGVDRHKLLGRLLNLLVVAKKMPHTDIADDLIYVAVNCIRKSPIKTLGIKWDDIEDEDDLKPITLLHNLARTKFDVDKGSECLFEGKGTVIFTKDSVLAAPVNKKEFLNGNHNLTTYLKIGHNINILLPKSDHMKNPTTVEDVAEGVTFMTRAQGGVKSSHGESKKKYAAGTIIPVVVKSNFGVKIEAETIHPEFTKIKGKVNINLNECLRYFNINHLTPFFSTGMVLLVEYTPDDPEFCFTLCGGYSQFYDDYANLLLGETLPAVYLCDYSAGTQWLTDEGVIVNIMGQKSMITDDDVLYAIDQHIPLDVRVNSVKSANGKVLVNGNFTDTQMVNGNDEPEPDMETYIHDVFDFLFSKYLKYCKDYVPEIDSLSSIDETDVNGVKVISNILVSHQDLLSDTMPRLTCLQTALMLSIAAGDYTMSAYIRHELEYQIAVARFVGGASPMSITLSSYPMLEGIPEVEKHKRIIEKIRNYKEPEIGHADDRKLRDENIEDTVDGLIDASNRLIGKIDDREIARIKLELAKVLDVDDQYRSPDLTTYYGVESDTLEFKTSAVCPPKNKLKGNAEYEPETQKWAILKTICGFLNSTTGGELLLGVRDNGIASGIQRDIELLYEDRRILEANSDRYRTYLKNIIDSSFIAYKSRAQKKSVTTANIVYNIETNNEGLEILRIHVDSYRGDMVHFHPDCNRPDDIQESYIRTSGATVPMSHTVRDLTLLKKYHLAGDKEGIGMAAIYEARNSKKRVLLKEYTSPEGVKDHEIEVFQVFPESKCILAYDTARKDVRLFKTLRWKDARILDKNCTQSSSSKRDLRPDIFGFVFDPSKPVYDVQVRLTNYGAILLQEEYPGSESVLTQTGRRDYPWLLNLSVNTLEGIVRFVRGLPNECAIEEGSDLHKDLNTDGQYNFI
ncbi:MAG: putative DNA binding domain-containing protein [Muribaculaceae bacterium]|nr:putative DNA binding domain-containing protein [Muribaculaceae bacterium]